ncbi:MAG: beta-xylosidase, partial [Sphingobacteriales bacterium]
MNMAPQLRDIEAGMKIALSYPETKTLPLIIGESDPEGCAACGMATNPSNAYRNGTMYSSYTAASFARKYELAEKYGVNLIGAVSWSFEFENQPWFYGFRDLATNGVDKPVLNVFRMFGMMKGKRVQVSGNRMYSLQEVLDSSVRRSTDIGALASKDKKSVAVMIWNYHDEDKNSGGDEVVVRINNLPAKKVKLTEYRIDDELSNSYALWKQMGSPQMPTENQLSQLQRAGMLQTADVPVDIKTNTRTAEFTIRLPRQAVSLLKLDW